MDPARSPGVTSAANQDAPAGIGAAAGLDPRVGPCDIATMSTRAESPAAAARAAATIALLAVISVPACHPAPRPAGSVAPLAPRETLITESDIAQMSVRTAWDAVRLRAPRLVFTDSAGRPSGIRIQPSQSVNADETPLLVVDGMRMSGVDYLQNIPAVDVHAIHILESDEAEPLYGLSAAGGAIVVETKSRPATGR